MTDAGSHLERREAERLRDAGASGVEVARKDVRWLSPRCRACGRGRVPRSVAHDLFGRVDVLSYDAARWTVVQCGHAGSQAAKRRALDAGGPYPPGTLLRVVTPDGRAGAARGATRAWERVVPCERWEEVATRTTTD